MHPTETRRVTKHLPVQLEKAGDTYRFVLSAADPDRVGDTIDPDAYEAAIAETPRLIALWQHNHAQPIGAFETLKRQGKRLVGDLKLASTRLAGMVRQLLDDGVPLGTSIGFRGRGEPNELGGLHFKELELLEVSVVSVPAHPKAQRILKSYGVELPSSVEFEPTPVSGPFDDRVHDAIRSSKAAILAANRTLRKT